MALDILNQNCDVFRTCIKYMYVSKRGTLNAKSILNITNIKTHFNQCF